MPESRGHRHVRHGPVRQRLRERVKQSRLSGQEHSLWSERDPVAKAATEPGASAQTAATQTTRVQTTTAPNAWQSSEELSDTVLTAFSNCLHDKLDSDDGTGEVRGPRYDIAKGNGGAPINNVVTRLAMTSHGGGWLGYWGFATKKDAVSQRLTSFDVNFYDTPATAERMERIAKKTGRLDYGDFGRSVSVQNVVRVGYGLALNVRLPREMSLNDERGCLKFAADTRDHQEQTGKPTYG